MAENKIEKEENNNGKKARHRAIGRVSEGTGLCFEVRKMVPLQLSKNMKQFYETYADADEKLSPLLRDFNTASFQFCH